jgi:hypothetical protein
MDHTIPPFEVTEEKHIHPFACHHTFEQGLSNISCWYFPYERAFKNIQNKRFTFVN